jgi:predicted Zn-dependent protease with MMP-like domain
MDADPGPSPSEAEDDPVERWVGEALDGLPPAFRERLGSVAIVIEDEATPDQLATVHATGLYGLYQGVPRSAWGADGIPIPAKITIFRGPLTRRHRDPDAQREAVIDTVRHEVAHHLGISDDRLRELDRERHPH